MEDFYHSIAWLEEAARLFRVSYGSRNTEDEGSLEDTLDHLAFSYFKVSPALPASSQVSSSSCPRRKVQERSRATQTAQRPGVNRRVTPHGDLDWTAHVFTQ